MRLRRLDLTRYGRFTDFSVDFGACDPSQPDLHVIHGPNEAGKSTLLAACLDLMFGIEKRSAYDFLHDYRSMRIGAALEIAGRAHEVVRIKRDNESLLGPGDQPIPEALLTAALGSIDRASYTMMFSLDDESLQSGGESILQSQGDLGRLLFSATSGLSELSRQLDDIKKSADAFHRPAARATELKQMKDRLAKLKQQQGEFDTNGRRYAELVETATSARTAYESAKTARDEISVRHDRLQRRLDALPLWANLKALHDRLEPLRDLPDPPAGWAEEAQQLSQDDASWSAQIKAADEDLVRLAGELEGIVVDTTILGLQERIDRLKDAEGRYRAAVDIAAREEERRGAGEQIAGLAGRLGRPVTIDPATLPLPAATVGGLNGLIETRSGVDARCNTARRERDAASDRTNKAMQALTALGVTADATTGVTAEVGALEALLVRVRAQEHGALVGHLRQRQAMLTAELEDDLTGLSPWRGDVDSLAALAMPERARIERWQAGLMAVREDIATLQRRQTEFVELRNRLTAEITAVKEVTGAVDDAQATAARSARDAAWQAHRDLLNAASADTFEAALSADDRLVESRLRQSADIARLRQADEEIARTKAALLPVEGQIATARACQSDIAVGIADALGPIGLPADTEPADLVRWLERRDTVLQKRTELRRIGGELQAANDAIADASAQLGAAMSAAGSPPDSSVALPRLLDLAQVAVTRENERNATIAAARKALNEEEVQLQQRQHEFSEAEQAVQSWQSAWSALLAGCWLGESPVEPSPAEVQEILQVLADVPALIEKGAELDRRIQAMNDDKARFIETIQMIAQEAGRPFETAGALEVAEDLRLRLSVALQQSKLRQSKETDLERATTLLREARQAMAEIDGRRREMVDLFATDTLTGLLQKLEQAKEKASLTQQIAVRECELVKAMKLASLAAAEVEIAEAAVDESAIEALRAESVKLATRLDDEGLRVTHLYHEAMTAEGAIAAIGGDAAVARLDEERRTLLLDIQEQTERHLRLKIGVAAAERALQIYRDRHRSSMMTRASDAFRIITRERFSDLATTPVKDGEALVGIQSNGGSLIASEMSKGTRFQLYLALRIAGYHEFAEHHEAVPFIADDIMETFDDNRSAEAFQLLARIAERGQVIYLTHHAHMRDLAQAVCGKRVHVHELPPPLTVATADILT